MPSTIRKTEMKNIIVTTFMLVILVGCSRQFNIEPEALIEKSEGILMASITKSSMTPSTVAHITYEKIDGGGTLSVSTKSFDLIDDYEKVDKSGQLVVIESEPGDYQLTGWQLNASSGYVNTTITPKDTPEPLSFTIKPGVITYIGNLHVKTTKFSKNMLGHHMVTGASISITDEQEEDKKVLYDKYPNISEWPINNEVPDGSKWQL